MWQKAHDTYLESRVLAAEPIELVDMLYQACMQAVRDARQHLLEGRIAERSGSITRAAEILMELDLSLDRANGGEIAGRLTLLYDYMQRQLTNANMQQSDALLAEVLSLLMTLSEGWMEMKAPRPEANTAPMSNATPVSNGWGAPAPPQTAAAGSQAWSF
jgi:flagellar protein FliS